MRRQARARAAAGFTLIELMIVVMIVGILAASSVPLYLSNTRRAKTVEALAGLGAIRHEQSAYKTEHTVYLAVAEGDIGNDPADAADQGLGLDFGDSAYFDGNSFSVTLDGTYGYIAKCDGGATGNVRSSLNLVTPWIHPAVHSPCRFLPLRFCG